MKLSVQNNIILSMNIAFFVDGYYPTVTGVISVITQLKREFERLGHKVIIVTVESRTDKSDTSMEQGVYRVPTIKAPLRKLKGIYIGFPGKKRVQKILIENKIQICHAHTEFPLGEAAHKAAKALKIPCVATTHTLWDIYYKFYFPFGHIIPRWCIHLWLRNFFGSFDALINVSQKSKNWAAEPYMVPKTPSAIIPNSFNEKKFSIESVDKNKVAEIRAKYNLKPGEKLILSAGRLVKEKRVQELFTVCSRLVTKRSDIKVLFVGGGVEEESLLRRLKHEKLEDKIFFSGFIPWDDIAVYYAACDIFVTVSLSEMHSMTILEALSMSKPVVCRKDSSFTDTVFDGQNGYLADTDDQIIEYIEKIADNPQLYDFMCKKAFEISRNFLLEKQVQRHIAFYEKLISKYPEKCTSEELQETVNKI